MAIVRCRMCGKDMGIEHRIARIEAELKAIP